METPTTDTGATSDKTTATGATSERQIPEPQAASHRSYRSHERQRQILEPQERRQRRELLEPQVQATASQPMEPQATTDDSSGTTGDMNN